MKKLLFLFSLSPLIVAAQTKKAASKTNSKAVVSKPKTSVVNDGFIINGTIEGLPEATSIQMLNGSSGAPEQTVTSQKGKFSFKGKLTSPDFKLIGINGQPPFITMFIENSNVTVKAKNGAFDQAVVSGSATNEDFVAFSKATKPYEEMLSGRGRFDVKFMDEAAMTIEKFINAHPSSFVNPLAIIRYNQLTVDPQKMETQFNLLSDTIKKTPMGAYIAQQVSQNASSNYGKPVVDFSQPDTGGVAVSLSSFKGKYVLIDFWASWCGPCRAENPNVVNTYSKFKDKNFTVLGVSLDRAKQNWIDAINMDHLTWTHVSDLQFWSNAVAQQFGIQSIPQNLLIDPQGNLVAKNLRGAALEYRLSKLLQQ